MVRASEVRKGEWRFRCNCHHPSEARLQVRFPKCKPGHALLRVTLWDNLGTVKNPRAPESSIVDHAYPGPWAWTGRWVSTGPLTSVYTGAYLWTGALVWTGTRNWAEPWTYTAPWTSMQVPYTMSDFRIPQTLRYRDYFHDSIPFSEESGFTEYVPPTCSYWSPHLWIPDSSR
ncbi:hypothetical protein FQN57_002363 [Myotisia sp. PD_48]|nr:hypothetical protein FQN57_002363 [Myotisia sp. PD_48]